MPWVCVHRVDLHTFFHLGGRCSIAINRRDSSWLHEPRFRMISTASFFFIHPFLSLSFREIDGKSNFHGSSSSYTRSSPVGKRIIRADKDEWTYVRGNNVWEFYISHVCISVGTRVGRWIESSTRFEWRLFLRNPAVHCKSTAEKFTVWHCKIFYGFVFSWLCIKWKEE